MGKNCISKMKIKLYESFVCNVSNIFVNFINHILIDYRMTMKVQLHILLLC